MPASRAETAALVADTIQSWVDDPDSTVEYAELLEDRWAVRMAQQARDFTTVWFWVGDRTVRYEAYVLPAPPSNTAEVYRQLLFRNQRGWRVHFSIDREGGIYLQGRTAIEHVTSEELEYALGEIYEAIELAFRPLLRSGFGR